MANEVKIGDGITIRTRNNSKYWQACIASKTGKDALRRSTGTANQQEAEVKAVQLATKFWEDEAAGLPTASRRFNQVADLYIKQMESELPNGGGKRKYKEPIRILRNKMIPFFTTKQISSLDIDDLYRYVGWRKDNRKGKEIARSYEKNENAAFNGLMHFACERKWISNKLTLPKVKTADPTDRTRFTDTEWRTVRSELYRLSKLHSKNATTVEIRKLMYDLSLFVRNSGMRCGRECLLIKWDQFEFVPVDQLPKQHRKAVQDSGQAEVLVLHLKQDETKTGKKRKVVFYNEHQVVSNVLMRLAERNADTKVLVEGMPSLTVQEKNDLLRQLFTSNEYVFRFTDEGLVSQLSIEEQAARVEKRSHQMSKSFTRVLNDLGLKKTKDGSDHSFYSLRHTYISKMLELGCAIAIVAKQVGNSIAVIEKFYNEASPLSNAPVLSGILATKEFYAETANAGKAGQYDQMSAEELTVHLAQITAAMQLKTGQFNRSA